MTTALGLRYCYGCRKRLPHDPAGGDLRCSGCGRCRTEFPGGRRRRTKLRDRIYPVGPWLSAVGRDNSVTAVMAAGRFNGVQARVAWEHGLTIEQADRLAIRAGLHPALIWTDWYDRD